MTLFFEVVKAKVAHINCQSKLSIIKVVTADAIELNIRCNISVNMEVDKK